MSVTRARASSATEISNSARLPLQTPTRSPCCTPSGVSARAARSSAPFRAPPHGVRDQRRGPDAVNVGEVLLDALMCSAATVTKASSSPSSIGPQKAKGPSPLSDDGPLCVELVGTTSSGSEGASQKQPQAKREDAKHQCEDRHDRHVGRQCHDAGVTAAPQVHEGGLWLRQLRVSRASSSVGRIGAASSPGSVRSRLRGSSEIRLDLGSIKPAIEGCRPVNPSPAHSGVSWRRERHDRQHHFLHRDVPSGGSEPSGRHELRRGRQSFGDLDVAPAQRAVPRPDRGGWDHAYLRRPRPATGS
jgi:hypothetical protein